MPQTCRKRIGACRIEAVGEFHVEARELGIPPPPGRATWTAIVIENVLKEER